MKFTLPSTSKILEEGGYSPDEAGLEKAISDFKRDDPELFQRLAQQIGFE